MAAARTFHIRPVLDGQPLAAVLKRLLPRESDQGLRRLLARRQVQLNGNVIIDPKRRVRGRDVVKVFEHSLAAPATEQDVRVRYRDEHLLVVEKPAGVTTLRQAGEGVPARRRDRLATLEEMLQRLLARGAPSQSGRPAPRSPEASRSKHPMARRAGARPPPGRQGAPRVRPVHRLDRDTSGLMIFALSADAEAALSAMFKAHEVDRTYTAVVHGHPREQTIDTYLVRDRGDGLRGSSPRGKDDPDAQQAVTHIRPLERVGAYSVVECRLETGRTHQIRIHLAEIGHALCGEKTYTRPAPNAAPVRDASGAPRQALHSASLAFTHPLSGKPLQFKSPLPPDLAHWLAGLRRAAAH